MKTAMIKNVLEGNIIAEITFPDIITMSDTVEFN